MTIWSNEFLKKEDGYYIVEVNTDTGLVISEKGPYMNQSIAKQKLTELQKKSSDKKKMSDMNNQISSIMKHMDDDDYGTDDFVPTDVDDRNREIDEAFDKKFVEDEESSLTSARSLLLSVAKLYLDAKIIDNNEYLKTRLNIEADSLASVLFQLKTSRLAIHKICQDINRGDYTPKMIEVLTSLQRVVLDISKFQHQYMTSIEKNLIEFKNQTSEIPLDNQGDTIINSNAKSLTFSNRSDLIKKMAEFVDQLDYKTPASINKSLTRDEDMVDPQHNAAPEIEEADFIDENPLDGFK